MVDKYVWFIMGISEDYTEGDLAKKGNNESVNIPHSRLLGEIDRYQKSFGDKGGERVQTCINAVYNHHFSFHTKGCFKCNKKEKKTHTCGPTCECRMPLPDRSHVQSYVKYHHKGKPWFKWDGTKVLQPLIEILPKRGT